ncbi:ATP-binding protein [Undibacterium fentianense]|uniref:histidine kinase n=1 Tax=Undibacterium fentianense TaxID=2828728 RepID=A0A941E3T5_9BURK|nr:ATP-binding protein [Undibacterium fentianense]MBR7800991.1 GHKL domain-containing protein [Undibacterium fentianense]
MKTAKPSSLQSELIALVLGTVLAVFILIASLTWLDASHEIDEILDSHLTQAASLLVVQEANEIGENEQQIDAPVLHRYAQKTLFQVFHEGRLSLRSANAPITPIRPIDQYFTAGFSTIKIDENSWRVFATHGAESDIKVFVAEKIETRASILQAVFRSVLVPLGLALPALGLAIWWSIRRGMRPLRHLSYTLQQRNAGSLEPLSTEHCNIEILPMLNALNDLFQRTNALHQAEQRFTADAAHELRTPIAALRAQAQVAMAESDPIRRQLAMQNTLTACDRAGRLVDQLLTLAKLENQAQIALQSTHLSRLIKQCLADLAPRAVHKQQQLSFDCDDGISDQIQANELLLTVLFRNLIDNAIRYSPSHAIINIRLNKVDKKLCVEIEDSGNGLDQAAIDRLGERFFRTTEQHESGSGLGWSIVRRIAEVHQLVIKTSRSEQLGGFMIHIEFQSQSQPEQA